ncbi:MAG: shikimate kinase AroL [Desulfovibrionaceae bacterium]
MEKNVFFIGPRASGKTSVGRAVAELMGRPFVDTDEAVAKHVGMDIAAWVEQFGWESFRDVESEVLSHLAASGGQIISCGGGIVLRAKNRNVIAQGLVVYLKAKPEILSARLMQDPRTAQRPSLTGRPVAEEVRQVLAEREPLYISLADIVVRDRESIEEEARQAHKEISARLG